MPKLTCPHCERSFDVDTLDAADLWRQRAELAAGLGPAWHIVNEYVDCFRATDTSRVTLKKRVRILREVLKLWSTEQFDFDGKTYRTARKRVYESLQTICNMGKLGFQNHNYLKRMLLSDARRLSAEGLTADEEQAREDRRRAEAQARAGDFARVEDGVLSPEEVRRRSAELIASLKLKGVD